LVMESNPKKWILVVENDEDWRSQVSASLGQAGYRVVPAKDGSEALAQAEDPCLNLVMVGDDLGGESGRMLARFLRKNHPRVPILLCTTRDYGESEVQDLMDEGIDQCVPKDNLGELMVSVGWCAR